MIDCPQQQNMYLMSLEPINLFHLTYRFLHDIISVLIRDKGIFDGLFTEEELISENVKGTSFFCHEKAFKSAIPTCIFFIFSFSYFYTLKSG